MKFLRFLLILIIILVVIGAILHFIAPKEINVTRTATINASKEAVMEQVVNFKNWKNWSPWMERDPNATVTYTGEDGKVGSTYHWKASGEKGREDVGEGEMKTEVLTNDSMGYSLTFLKPWKSVTSGGFSFSDNGKGGTDVSWSMHFENKFPGTIFSAFMDMDKMIGNDFEKGLAKIDSFLKANPSMMAAGGSVQEMDFPGHNYATIRQTLNISDEAAMFKFFGDSYSALGKAAGARINGPASCLAYDWNQAENKADLAAAFPVSGTQPVAGATMVNVPAGKSYQYVLTGPYSGLYGAHDALQKHANAAGKTPKWRIEEYVKGPGDESDSSKWITNVIYVVE